MAGTFRTPHRRCHTVPLTSSAYSLSWGENHLYSVRPYRACLCREGLYCASARWRCNAQLFFVRSIGLGV